MDELYFKILMTVVTAICIVITYIVVPYIKSLIDANKLAKYEEWAKLAVETAEMIWTESGMGKQKKEYVLAFLTDLINKKKTVITQEQLDVLIEAAVKELKISQK